MKTCFSQELYIDWNIMCLSVCGKLLPVTALSFDDDDEHVSMIHEIAETATALTFSDGTVGRAIIFKYPLDILAKTDIN